MNSAIQPGQDTIAHAQDLRQSVAQNVSTIAGTPTTASDVAPGTEIPLEDTFGENIQEAVSGGTTDPSRNYLKKTWERLSKIAHRQNPNSMVVLEEKK